MEQLFMQVFERRDWVATQVQQQADSYAQTLACSLLAAGHRPPEWLIPSGAGGPQQELNGKPIVPGLAFTGSQITTPAANRNFFLPQAIPNTLIRKLEVSNAYTEPVNNCAALSTLVSLDDDQHEEPQQEQTSLSKELANTSAEVNMFSRIQRSKSRQKNIENHRCGRDQAANSGSCDGIQDGTNKSKLGAVGSNTKTVTASSRSFGDAANNTKTKSSRPRQGDGSVASQGRLTDLLKCHNNLGSQGNQLDCLLSLALENKIICSDNNSAARDLKMAPLPDNSELNIGDTTCHAMSETHLLVEPKKLQFDSTESVCMGLTSEQMGRQQESALESDNFGVADQNLLSEDTYPANSSQESHYMDRSSLDGLKSDYLKGVNADLKHKQYGLESGHHDLSSLHSLNEEPSLNCSTEIPSFVGDPLLQETTLYVPENNSKLSRTQEAGLLKPDEIKCSEISHSVVNPLLEKDTPQALEDTTKTDSSNPKVSPPSSGPLQLSIQLADASFKANESSGMSMNNLLGEDGHNHISNLLTNGTNSRCSLGLSSVSVVQLPPQTFTSDNVCQSSPLSYGTSNGAHSNGFAAVDTFESSENMLPQDQYLLARSSLEFGRGIAYADASSDHRPPDMHNEMLVGNLTSELVNCPSGKLGDDVHLNKTHDSSIENKMSQFVAPKVVSSVSSGRTRKVHKGERGSVIPSGKCNGSLQQEGIEQDIPSVGNVPKSAEACMVQNVEPMKSSRPSVQYCLHSSVSYEKNNQLQTNRGYGRKRSVADGVQVNGGTSSKRKRIKCQGITHSNSSRTNSLSLNHQDGNGTNAVTAENLSERSRPSGRYLLRSSGFNELMSLKFETKNAATNSKVSVASDIPETGDTSPKLIKNSHLSNVAICGSSRGEALSPNLSCSSDSRCVVEGMDFRNSETQFQTNFDNLAASTLQPAIVPDIEECNTQEENHCLEGVGLSDNISNVKQQEMTIQTDENVIVVNQDDYSGTGSCLTMLPSHALEQHGKHTSSDLVASIHKKLSFDSGMKLDPRCGSEDPARFVLSDATILRQEGDESVNCNNILPEFECFNVSLPLDSPATAKRTYEALCDPRRFGTLSLDISSKYKDNTVSGMHQIVETTSKKPTSYSFSGDVRQYSVSSDDSIADTFGSCGLGISGSFLPSDTVASCSSNDSDKHVSGENPLTPAVEKYSLGKLSARVGSISEHMGSIPELSCFRIDEDSGIAEENDYQDMLPESEGNQMQSGRRALQDITGLCQNTENCGHNSLGFMDTANVDLTSETCSMNLSLNSGLKNDHNSKKPKESCASVIKREGKVSHSLLNRLSKTEVTDNRNQRYTSESHLGKRYKLSNIVANVTSFIPHVKPKPSTTACAKKDVRVKALEAAEAAKRLEEKKQIEREMRKAAAKLEREKIKKEKESKQKQEQEQKKKRDIDMATRKRQRDEEERREKERKRRCAEETRKQQKQPTERRHASDEKDAHPKAPDNKELQKNLVEVVKSEVKPDERIDLGNKAITTNNDVAVDGRPATFRSHGTDNIRNSLDESYVMTPYKDSDDEDDDEEASRRRKKLKPSWVREENLVKILLSDNQALDPREIFAQKCSFNLSDVLPVHVPLRVFK